MKIIFRYFRRAISAYPKQFFISICLNLVLTGLNACVPWGLHQYLEKVAAQNTYGIIALGIGFFALYLAVQVFVKIAWYISLIVKKKCILHTHFILKAGNCIFSEGQMSWNWKKNSPDSV